MYVIVDKVYNCKYIVTCNFFTKLPPFFELFSVWRFESGNRFNVVKTESKGYFCDIVSYICDWDIMHIEKWQRD